MSDTPTSKALKKGREEAPVAAEPVLPDPEKAPIKELTAYCKAMGQVPEDWNKIKAPEKRVAFQRLFCPQVTEGFDPGDKLHLIAERVENMKESDLVDTVARLTEGVGDNYYELGGVFSRVIAEGWYTETDHENFKDWVAATTDMKHAKARFLIQIYDKLNRLDIPWSKFSGIGWTKVRLLLSVLTTENADEWIKKARAMNRSELEDAVKGAKGEKVDDPTGEGEGDSTINKGFKFHKEQWEVVLAALEQMKGELPTDFDNVAMEHICATYLSGDQGDARVIAAGEPATVEEAHAGLKLIYSWLKENTDTPYDAAVPVCEAFESVFTQEEAYMFIKEGGPPKSSPPALPSEGV